MSKQINIFGNFYLILGYPSSNLWVKAVYSDGRYLDYLDRLRTENSYLASWAYKKGRR